MLLWNEKGYVESTMKISEAPGLTSYWLLVIVLALSAEDRGLSPDLVNPKIILVRVASALNTEL